MYTLIKLGAPYKCPQIITCSFPFFKSLNESKMKWSLRFITLCLNNTFKKHSMLHYHIDVYVVLMQDPNYESTTSAPQDSTTNATHNKQIKTPKDNVSQFGKKLHYIYSFLQGVLMIVKMIIKGWKKIENISLSH